MGINSFQGGWQCETCMKTYTLESDALRCEDNHAQVNKRIQAYREALSIGNTLVGYFSKDENEIFHLVSVVAIISKDERSQSKFAEVRYIMADANTLFKEYLPDVSGSHRKYISITEAINAGWCPFFSKPYQENFPLAFREQIANSFLNLPPEVQRENLLKNRLFLRFGDDK